ncbi:MAG: DNA mismatch repair protein MutS [Clostridiales Family XIII bacterium]|jgi:DNA mismatch repair protein MutS|nr:DNA mismatch repair protein MutS [Clostridiales Family XIII bacterium]
MSKYSPMLQQYMDIKEQYQDCILFFRLGDFYEMFYDDAITASQVLEITLTKKTVGGGLDRAPLCGVPYHSAESYIAKLIDNGYKVAICEQMEDPKLVKGLVKRDVVRVVTPGTVTGDTMLSANSNNYLACVAESEDAYGVAWCDISTGELNAALISGEGREASLESRIAVIGASELIQAGDTDEIARGKRVFESLFGASGASAYGVSDEPVPTALYGLFHYLDKTQKQQIAYMRPPALLNYSNHMILDRASVRSLELTETMFDRQVKGSLLGVLDRTHTAMGGRLIKKWLKEPLVDVGEIRRRLDAVEALTEDVLARNHIKECLKAVYDIERLVGRVSYGSANARDLIALKRSIEAIPGIKSEIADIGMGGYHDAGTGAESADDGAPDAGLLQELAAGMDEFAEAREMISSAIVDEPPFTVREGGIVRDGYSEELDELKNSVKGGQDWIAGLEAKERERTGIKTLKVGYNKVFGYYIDITHANRDLVPQDYIRKQTLVNSERYITLELQEKESTVLGAEARINELEYRIFDRLRTDLQVYIPALQRTAEALAALDALTSFAETGSKYGYVKPVVNEGDVIEIERGRHPVIERSLKETVFVPNDVYIDRGKRSMLLITGPNMAGKSTYMRQTALIVLMAQAGCFVPAERAHIGAIDRLYTRIGASDNLARGESTFYVEMSELAYILNTATENSLVILDEIGRGTSTYDGLAIAWAVIDYLCGANRIRTLFATHYHELTALEGTAQGLVNLNSETADTGDDVVFLHRIAEGPANRSYGIHVAKLAGVPRSLLGDAQEKLDRLESGKTKLDVSGAPDDSKRGEPAPPPSEAAANADAESVRQEQPAQLSMFSFAPNPVIDRLKALDLMAITPSEAFAILEDLKKAAGRT